MTTKTRIRHISMRMKVKNVTEYIVNNLKFREEISALRSILRRTHLSETTKWNLPVYTRNGKNILFIDTSADYCSICFFEGAKLSDSHLVLSPADGGIDKNIRIWKFKNTAEIRAHQHIIFDYINELAKKLTGVVYSKNEVSIQIPFELQIAFALDDEFQGLFKNLPKYIQAEYIDSITNGDNKQHKMMLMNQVVHNVKQKKYSSVN